MGLDASILAPKIQGLHIVLATLTKNPIFLLAPAEAQTMAEAIAEVTKYYDIVPSGKTMAIGNLVAVAGMIYLPRMMQVKAQKAQEKAERRASQPTTVEEAVHNASTQQYDLSGI